MYGQERSHKSFTLGKNNERSSLVHLYAYVYRYMYRRCHFLEECPYLKYNQGRAPGDAVRDKTGKMVHKNYKDTSKLRSVLFHTMRREVAHFSEQCVGTHEQTRKYHQV